MSLSTKLPTAILDTILGRLALLFLSATAGDTPEARNAAAETLADYHPETASELRLAANIVSFSFHALEALSQAADPDMSLTKILRLRGSAVSLSRESHKAERRLRELQSARRAGQPEPQVVEATPAKIDKAIALVEANRQQTPAPTWSKSHQQREAARRITENLRKNQAAHAAAANATTAAALPRSVHGTNGA
jgi:hypothetical protein